jgi:predicted N-acetyltransferase YhbS
VILARLAVDNVHQGRGLGRSLLQDALLRCAAAAREVGVRACVVHALPEARAFYEAFGFEPSPTDSLHLTLLMKDLQRFLAEEG